MLSGLDWSPLVISLKTGFVAMIISFFIGIWLAWGIYKANEKVRVIVDGIFTLPLVLPPTVAGFILLLIFSTRRPVGTFLLENFNIKVIQSWLGCVIAAMVISFPLMYRNARAAFDQVDKNLIFAARTLGMSESKILYKVAIPSASPGLISGAVLTFARAMGEYGATSMLAGNIPGKTATISQRIAMVIQDGDYASAGVWVVIVTVIALVIILLLNVVLAKLMRK
jgi:molybdate transport system permease protein